jgi:hypothetical protein
MTNDGKRIAIVCGTCGSDEVSRDAWANWDVHAQDWVLGSVFDHAHCHRCGCESRLVEFELANLHPS